MVVSLLLAFAAWLALLGATCAWLAAAKRADAAIDAQRTRWAHELVADLGGGDVDGSLVVAVREPRPAGQVVAVAGRGAAAAWVGRVLPPDDSITARAALSGRCEARGRAAAAPVCRAGTTIGAIGLSLPAGHGPIGRRELDFLVRAADVVGARLGPDVVVRAAG